jgi:hypothetical protein
MSTIATSGLVASMRARSSSTLAAWPTTVKPASSSRLAIPSRTRSESSATTMRGAARVVLLEWCCSTRANPPGDVDARSSHGARGPG